VLIEFTRDHGEAAIRLSRKPNVALRRARSRAPDNVVGDFSLSLGAIRVEPDAFGLGFDLVTHFH